MDELLTWSIANAKTISNNYGEIKIDKDITTDRIDPIDAIIDAWKPAMKEEYKLDINESVNDWLHVHIGVPVVVAVHFNGVPKYRRCHERVRSLCQQL